MLAADALDAERTAVLGRERRAHRGAQDARVPAGRGAEELRRRAQPAQGAVRGGVRCPGGALEAERRRREGTGIDLTMPGRRHWVGAEHPVTKVVDEIVGIFRELGFAVATGPEVETEWYNFLALNFPPDHPAMDMHDTLYLDAPPAGRAVGRLLLRTHTSPVQIRTMLAAPPPVRVVIPGMVYRNDAMDASHCRPSRRSKGSRWTRGSPSWTSRRR